QATAGSSSFTLTVTGTNFTTSSVVQWNGASRPTTYAQSTQLRASIPSSDIASAGTAQVTVADGGVSNGLPFSIVLSTSTIDSLQAGQWFQVPNSNLSAVLPNPLPPGNPVNIMAAWSGGAYDTTRDRLIIWGGGHADYAGNEIYVFDVNSLT